ncbi:hypothetical protein EK21DRAFT_110100 [Setomelanomma holmii]|uniref:WW domain-containing protein n=1 Tax=Setomelanomma holmii TaxID=210430 RepID=A0A9P4HDA2_9PLEO|nr:hypothetical protein EK21DRAFT_110100 [Setomelanomma holmii]
MPKYQYSLLDVAAGEIRLLELHPGAFDDTVSISMNTVPLVVPPRREDPMNRLEAIRASLPDGWRAYETEEDRVIFWDRRQRRTSWNHPDPQQTHTSQLQYEALSYTWGIVEVQQPVIHVISPSSTSSELQPLRKSEELDLQTNLLEALKHLRTTDTPRTLWIDAICIN